MKIKLNNTYIPIKKAVTFKDRLLGLIGKQNITYGMLFPRCNAIHTFFMQEPIDVIALNSNNEVIFVIKKLAPNKLCKVKSPLSTTSILELPQNTATVRLHEKIHFIN